MRKKRGSAVLSVVVSAVLAVSLCPALALADESVEESAEEPQSVTEGFAAEPQVQSAEPVATVAETNTVEVNTAADLQKIAENVNTGIDNYAGKTVKLMADIDLAGIAWTPIGLQEDSQYVFAGVFDGGGRTISNLTVSTSNSDNRPAGLFGIAAGGTLKDFTIVNAQVSNLIGETYTVKGSAAVVGCAGDTNRPLMISNVHVENAAVASNRYVGGIAGYVYGLGTVIDGCSVEDIKLVATPDSLSGKYDNGDKVGGIAGYSNVGVTITDCTLKGNVSISGYRDMGGIVGMVQATTTLTDNTNSATLRITVNTSNMAHQANYNVGEFYGREPGGYILDSSNKSGQDSSFSVAKGAFTSSVYVSLNEDPDGKNRDRIWCEMGGFSAAESIVVKMYSGATLISTTELAQEVLDKNPTDLTLNLVVFGKPAGSWNTTWELGQPVANAVPDKLVLLVDGEEVDFTSSFVWSDKEDGSLIKWENVRGVNPVPEEKPLPPADDDGADGIDGDGASDVKPVAKADADTKSLAKTGDSAGIVFAGLGVVALAAAGACAVARRRAE